MLPAMCQTSAFVPALQKVPPGAAKAAAAKGKGSKQKTAEEGGAAAKSPAASPKQGRRPASKPAAGMISQLSRRLLHMRIMLCELLPCLVHALVLLTCCTA